MAPRNQTVRSLDRIVATDVQLLVKICFLIDVREGFAENVLVRMKKMTLRLYICMLNLYAY